MTNQEILAAGNAAFNAGDADKAIALLGRVSANDPQIYGQALLLMGRAYMRQQDLDQAKICLEESYHVRKHARTLFHLGECLYQAGDRAGAEKCLEAATASDETLTDAFIMLGVVRKEAGRHKEALPCFDRALKNDPKAVVARYQIAQVTFELGDLQRAAAQAHHVIQHAADFAPAHLLMANITLKLGDYRQAAVEFCTVLELNGPDAAIYMSLGRAFAHLQDVPQALAAFEAAFQLEPDSELACSAVARLADRVGDKEKAGQYYRLLLRFEGSVQLATEALTRLGLPADPPPQAPAKKGKKGKIDQPKGKPQAPAIQFQPPKMIDRSGLPSSLPTRQTGRVISPTAPLPKLPSGGTSPLPRSNAPTGPLDNILEGINRLIDQTPLKGSFDAQAVGEKATTMVNRLKSEILSRVKGDVSSVPTPSKPSLKPQGPASGGLKPPGEGSKGKLTANRPKPKP